MKHFIMLPMLLWFSIFAVSCGTKSVEEKADSNAYSIMINEFDRIAEDESKGLFLNSNSEEDKKIFKTEGLRAKVALLKLEQNEYDSDALYMLYDVYKKLLTIKIFDKDEEAARTFIKKLSTLINDVAKKQGIVLEDLVWSLFKYEFSQGVAPFKTTGKNGVKWTTDISREVNYIKVEKDRDITDSWLISPTFDLSKIDNPSFQFEHLLILSARRGVVPFDRLKIISETVNVFVSTDYVSGEPDTAKWTKVDIGPRPTSVDFHKVLSPKIDLSRFKSKNTTIAFRMQYDEKIHGGHYMVWQVNKFELFGAGNLFGNSEETFGTTDPFKSVTFVGGLGEMKELILEGTKNQWEYPNIPNVTINAAAADARNAKKPAGTGLLYSEIIDLKNIKNAQLMVNQAISFSKTIDLKLMDIVVTDASTNADVKSLAWESLTFKQIVPYASTFDANNKEKKVWKAVETEWISLPKKFQNKKIRIGFKYTAQENKANTFGWQINSFHLRDSTLEEKSVQTTPALPLADITPPPPPPPPAVVENHSLVKAFDLTKDFAGEFTNLLLDGSTRKGWIFKTEAMAETADQNQFQGTALLHSKIIDLVDAKNPVIQINQAFRCNFSATNNYCNRVNEFIKVQIAVAEDLTNVAGLTWTVLNFTTLPKGDSDNKPKSFVTSEWLKIPQEFHGKKVIIAFSHTTLKEGDKTYSPSWKIKNLQINSVNE